MTYVWCLIPACLFTLVHPLVGFLSILLEGNHPSSYRIYLSNYNREAKLVLSKHFGIGHTWPLNVCWWIGFCHQIMIYHSKHRSLNSVSSSFLHCSEEQELTATTSRMSNHSFYKCSPSPEIENRGFLFTAKVTSFSKVLIYYMI